MRHGMTPIKTSHPVFLAFVGEGKSPGSFPKPGSFPTNRTSPAPPAQRSRAPLPGCPGAQASYAAARAARCESSDEGNAVGARGCRQENRLGQVQGIFVQDSWGWPACKCLSSAGRHGPKWCLGFETPELTRVWKQKWETISPASN